MAQWDQLQEEDQNVAPVTHRSLLPPSGREFLIHSQVFRQTGNRSVDEHRKQTTRDSLKTQHKIQLSGLLDVSTKWDGVSGLPNCSVLLFWVLSFLVWSQFLSSNEGKSESSSRQWVSENVLTAVQQIVHHNHTAVVYIIFIPFIKLCL